MASLEKCEKGAILVFINVAFNTLTSDCVFQRRVTSAGCRVFPWRWRTLSLTLYVTHSRRRVTSCKRLNSTTWWVWLFETSHEQNEQKTCNSLTNETSRKSLGSPSSKSEIEVKVVNLRERSTVQLKIRSLKLSILGVWDEGGRGGRRNPLFSSSHCVVLHR